MWSVRARLGTLDRHVTKLRAILFDFGGTLDLRSHWLDRFLECYRATGLDLKREELDPAFSHATRVGYSAGSSIESFGLAELAEFLIENQVEYLRANGPYRIKGALADRRGNESLERRVRERFVKKTSEGLRRSRLVLETLRSRFKLGIVSNWYGNLEAVLAEAGMRSLVDVAVDSTRVGFFKPDPRIFQAALSALAVTADETAMVGDSVAKDCLPAHRLGMRTVLLRADVDQSDTPDAPDATGERDYVPDYTIGSLDEILSIQW